MFISFSLNHVCFLPCMITVFSFVLQKSSICRSAIHAGVIKNEQGGYIDVMPVESRLYHYGSYQNNVLSERYKKKITPDRLRNSNQIHMSALQIRFRDVLDYYNLCKPTIKTANTTGTREHNLGFYCTMRGTVQACEMTAKLIRSKNRTSQTRI